MFVENRKNDVIEGLIRSQSAISSFLTSPSSIGSGGSQAGPVSLCVLEILEYENIFLAKKCGYKEKEGKVAVDYAGGGETEVQTEAVVDDIENKNEAKEEREEIDAIEVGEDVIEETIEATQEDLNALETSDALLNLILPLINDTAVISSDFHKHNCFAKGIVFRNYCGQ